MSSHSRASEEPPPQAARGVADEAAARLWCRARRIDDIECIIPDQAGRGARQADADAESSSAATR